MILTKHSDYAIRILMYLAINPGKKVPIASIAEAHKISRNHLMKVSQNLAHLGYIIGYRGKGGGIALARPARSISIGQLLEQIERNLKPSEAMNSGQPAPSGKLFEQSIEDARAAFIATLVGLTLAQLVNDAAGNPRQIPKSQPIHALRSGAAPA